MLLWIIDKPPQRHLRREPRHILHSPGAWIDSAHHIPEGGTEDCPRQVKVPGRESIPLVGGDAVTLSKEGNKDRANTQRVTHATNTPTTNGGRRNLRRVRATVRRVSTHQVAAQVIYQVLVAYHRSRTVQYVFIRQTCSKTERHEQLQQNQRQLAGKGGEWGMGAERVL